MNRSLLPVILHHQENEQVSIMKNKNILSKECNYKWMGKSCHNQVLQVYMQTQFIDILANFPSSEKKKKKERKTVMKNCFGNKLNKTTN